MYCIFENQLKKNVSFTFFKGESYENICSWWWQEKDVSGNTQMVDTFEEDRNRNTASTQYFVPESNSLNSLYPDVRKQIFPFQFLLHSMKRSRLSLCRRALFPFDNVHWDRSIISHQHFRAMVCEVVIWVLVAMAQTINNFYGSLSAEGTAQTSEWNKALRSGQSAQTERLGDQQLYIITCIEWHLQNFKDFCAFWAYKPSYLSNFWRFCQGDYDAFHFGLRSNQLVRKRYVQVVIKSLIPLLDLSWARFQSRLPHTALWIQRKALKCFGGWRSSQSVPAKMRLNATNNRSFYQAFCTTYYSKSCL